MPGVHQSGSSGLLTQPLSRNPLCGSLAGCREDNLDVDTGTGKHAHKGIDAEEIGTLPRNEIADPRLRDAQQLGRSSLGELALLDELTDEPPS